MLSSLLESYIKTYAGKYLKNFSSEKVNVGLNNVKLTDIELDVDQLWKIKIPIKPKRAFIGEITADLSFVLGGKLEIAVKDVLFLFDKDDYEDMNDPQSILSSLQSIISMLYFTVEYPFPTGDPPTPPVVDVDSVHRVFDRLSLTVENVHFRIEELHTSYIPSVDDLMVTGIQFSRLTVRSASAKEVSGDPHFFVTQANSTSSNGKQLLFVNKVGSIEGLLAYCRRGRPLIEDNVADFVLSAPFVRSSLVDTKDDSEGVLLHPLNIHIKVSGAYDKQSLLLRPVRVHLSTDSPANDSDSSVTVNGTDEQASYLHHLVEFVREYPNRMQSLSRGILLSGSPSATTDSVRDSVRDGVLAVNSSSSSYRAKVRWRLVKLSIKSDWLRYSLHLPLQGQSPNGGPNSHSRSHERSSSSGIRWRGWFTIWALSGRYVAMREVLMYHVGYEQLLLPLSSSTYSVQSYAPRENLKLHYFSNTFSSEERENQGIVGVDPVDVETAMLIVDTIISGQHPFNGVLDVMPGVIKALYAMQLELDSLLPLKVSAFCRRRAEEKYHRRLSRRSLLANNGSIKGTAGGSAAAAAAAVLNGLHAKDNKQAVLLVAVIEAVNLKPTFAASAVHVNLSAKALYSDGTNASVSVGESKVVVARLNHCAKTTFAQFNSSQNSTFAIPLPSSDTANSSLPGIQLELFDRSLLQLSIGRKVLQSSSSLHAAIEDYRRLLQAGQGAESASLAAIESHDITLSDSSNANDSKEAPVIRIVVTCLYGDPDHIQTETKRFQAETIDPLIRERRSLLQRQIQLQSSSFSAASVVKDESEEEEAFILDPSLLTVQDMCLSAAIPSFKLVVSGQYAVPVAIRAQVFMMSSANSEQEAVMLPRSLLVPVYTMTVRDMTGVIRAANNPLTANGEVRCGGLRFQSHSANDDREGEGGDGEQLSVRLPRMSMSFDVTQTSTMSRFLDGRLDRSCFDSRCTLNLTPSLSIRINSPNMIDLDSALRDEDGNSLDVQVEQQQQQAVEVHSLWRSRRPLSHLLLPAARWAKVAGCGSSSQVTTSSKRGVEVKQRLGDEYSLFPLHLNVVKAVSAWLSHRHSKLDSKRDSHGIKLPEQVLTVRCATLGRSLDCCLKLQPPPSPANNQGNSNAASASAAHITQTAAAASQSHGAVAANGTPQWLSWMIPPTAAGTTSTAAPAAASSASKATANASNPAAVVGKASGINSYSSSNWASEKREMLSMVAELQRENQRLAAKLAVAEAKVNAVAAESEEKSSAAAGDVKKK